MSILTVPAPPLRIGAADYPQALLSAPLLSLLRAEAPSVAPDRAQSVPHHSPKIAPAARVSSDAGMPAIMATM